MNKIIGIAWAFIPPTLVAGSLINSIGQTMQASVFMHDDFWFGSSLIFMIAACAFFGGAIFCERE